MGTNTPARNCSRSLFRAIKLRLPGGHLFKTTGLSAVNYLQHPFEKIFFWDLLFWTASFFFTEIIRDAFGFSYGRYRTMIREEGNMRVKNILFDISEITINGMTFLLPEDPSGRGDLFGMLYDILPHDGLLKTGDRFFAYYSEGPYESDQVSVREGDLVIDAGANIGVFSVLAAKKGARVYAFEPQEQAAVLLRKHITVNGLADRITHVDLGLYDKPCTMPFIINTGCIAASAISEGSPDPKFTAEKIQCTDLDTWVDNNNIRKVDFIKADIEGAERYLLAGAKKTIRRDHPKISICTYHDPDDPEILKNLILEIDPAYKLRQSEKKLYAW